MLLSWFCVAVDPAFKPQVAWETAASAEKYGWWESPNDNVHPDEPQPQNEPDFILSISLESRDPVFSL